MSPLSSPLSCEQFEALVSDLVDDALSPPDRAVMEAHVASCASCRALHAELSGIVSGAATLPLLSPSRDLWAGIAERLDTPVVAIGTSGTHAVQRRRSMSLRQFAAAAVLIVAASSGATFVLTRATASVSATPPVASVTTPDVSPPNAVEPEKALMPAAPQVASNPTRSAANVTPPAGVRERERSRYAANDGAVEMVYEREITAMRRIVDERLGDLDSATVVEIERNLQIIDKAITDSRRALDRDPRSRFLSSQLDRALETKLGVLRRIALL